MTGKMLRQGDVLLQEIKEFPLGVKPTSDCVLAEGEAIGHKHLLSKAVQVLVDKQGNKFFEAGTETVLVHDEHKPVKVPKGKFMAVIQREYSPQANRKVMD